MGAQPHLLVTAEDVHDVALVPGDPDRVWRIADRCDDAEEVATNREFAVVNAVTDGRTLTICSTGIGAPSAAIAIEELVRCEVDTFVRVGTCGALQADIDIGDHVVATAAGKDEGTTKRYESETLPAVADDEVVRALTEYADLSPHPTHIGPIVTDDAYYAETAAYVERWNEANILAVEMEAAAVMTLARRYGCRSGAICTVDGNLVSGTQKGETDTGEELPAASDEAVGHAIDIALAAVRDL